MATIMIDNNKYPIKAILLDKDGTITELDDIWTEPTVAFMGELLDKYPKNMLSSEEKQAIFIEAGIKDGQLIPNTLATTGSMMDFSKYLANYITLEVSDIYQRSLEYFCEFIKQNPDKIKPIGDLKELFQKLTEANILIGLVTNDSLQTTNMILEMLAIKDYFSFVATPDEFPEKPDLASLEYFCSKHQILPQEVIYVGDSLADMLYGQATLAAVAVVNNPKSQASLTANSKLQIDSVMDLLKLVESD